MINFKILPLLTLCILLIIPFILIYTLFHICTITAWCVQKVFRDNELICIKNPFKTAHKVWMSLNLLPEVES